MDICGLSKQFHVNAERGTKGSFPVFCESVRRMRVLILSDRNTVRFTEEIKKGLSAGSETEDLVYPSFEPVADERAVELAVRAGERADYLLAVGSGTLNDLAKRAGFLLKKPCGVLATAPSMDGFTSGVTPLIENGFKITRNSQTVSDVLLDEEILKNAPRIMLGAGVGDILAKYCALADWRLSSLMTGEKVNAAAVSLMFEAVKECDASVPSLVLRESDGVNKLMDALLISGYAMVLAGNSRPASGAEHHLSHFLEMDFLARGERIPLHGIKVGLGTMVSLYLYRTLPLRPPFEGFEKAAELALTLPSEEYVRGILKQLDCPTRFSQIGVPKDTAVKMFTQAYKIRDRFTILTLYCTRGWMNRTLDELMDTFY